MVSRIGGVLRPDTAVLVAPPSRRTASRSVSTTAPFTESPAGRTLSGRDRILQEARAQFVAHGFAGVTMQRIADAIGVTKAALYYHVSDKEELFGEAFIGEMERVCAGIAAALEPEQPLETQLAAVARFLLDTSGLEFARLLADFDRYVSLERRTALLARAPRPREVLRSAFERAAASGEIKTVELDVAVALFLSMVFGQVRNVAFGRPAPASNEALAAAVASMVMRGIGAMSNESAEC
jgi:TetR/AcrR family transcriptional regulator of autoinduction and epiphytic fitness